MSEQEFNPDWVSPPGDTLRDWLKECNVTTGTVIDSLGLSAQAFARLLKGEIPITYELAYKLGRFTRTDMDFWLNREDDYRKVPRRSKGVSFKGMRYRIGGQA